MSNLNFIPIILGTDINAYGTARSFHEQYGIPSKVFGCKALSFTANSNFIDVKTWDNFDTQDVFLEKMLSFGKSYENSSVKLLLISCGDGYTSLIINNKNLLSKYFLFNYIDLDLQKQLENKKDFYSICEKYGLDYPKTYIINNENKDNFEVPFDFPMAVKANDSIEFLHLEFEGKKKAYEAHNIDELKTIITNVYNSGYSGDMIVQDFIPGDSSSMAVLNAYVDTKGNVKMMCFARCLLDECLPAGIGNYNALLTSSEKSIYEKYYNFLTELNYRGFANFDLKYDSRDNKYKIFEINIRQGRSSYYMTASGCNFVKFLVDDLIFNKNEDVYYHENEHLWLYVDPYVLKKYVNPKDLPLVKKHLSSKNYSFTQWYSNDRNIKRYLNYIRRRLSTIKYYPKYHFNR